MKSLANNISTYRTILPRHVSKVLLLLFLLLDFSEAKAQAFCNNPLGSLAPNLNWQYVSHNALGYYTFNATAGCTYQFTYCSSFAPSASYSGDPYITISTGATSGAIVTNDDYCGLGSYLSWTAPSTGLYYFNVGNCCSPQCGSISTRTFGYRSTNCAGTTPSPTGITASSTTICAGQSTTLTAQGAFGTQFWYTGSCGGSQVGTGATLTVTPNTTTTYYVNNNSNGQFGANCATITISVNPAPVAPTVSGNVVFCGSASTTLTASGGANYYWYSNAAGTNQVATGPTFTTPVLNSTTTYYVSSGQIAPPVPGNPVTFNYTGGNQTYTVPAGVSALNVDIRGAGGGISGGIQGGQGGRITGTLPVMAGTTYNIIVGGAGQPRTYNRSASGGGGFSGVLQGTTHLISAGGGGGAAGDGAAGGPGGAGGAQNGVTAPCGNGGAAGVGGLSGGVGGNGITNGGNGSNTGGGNGGNGGNNRAAGGGGGGFGTNAGVGGAQATVGGQGGNGGFGGGGGGGGGGWGSTNARLSAGGGGGGGYAGGGGGSVGINCGSGGGGGGGGGSNYADPSVTSVSSTVGGGGSPGGNGQVIITPIGGGGGCPSQLTPVTITVNPSPTITVSGVTICSGQTATLTATTNMQGGTFSWSPGNLSGATINVAPNATTTYTVTYTLAGCGSVTASATVTVNQSPAAPTSSGVTLCGPGSTTLSATGGQNNNYTWYSNSNATGQLGTGPNFTTPTLSTTTTYYVGTMSQGGNTTGTQTFNYTGAPQSFTAPATGNYTLTLYGAQGGNGLNTTGGLGGQATGSLALTAGQTISVYVGGKGGNAGGVVGWNGGGQGGLDIGAGQHGGSGGGATDIRVGGTGLANRVIVAGGGAGGGRDGATGVGGGSSGTTSANFSSGYGGTGGTQAAGGVAWTLTRGATDGSLGQGGNGSTGYNSAGGGGGGGGYYGGGGGTSTQNHGSGWSAGGGGGSSYIGGVLGGSTTQGVQSNDGLCTISWNIAAVGCPSALTPVTVTVNPIPIITVNNATICAGQPATLTATSSVAGGSFAWSPGGQSGASITVSPNTNTTYTATYTLAGCPPTTGTGNITVTPLQPITGTLNACIGQSSQLSNAVTPGSWVSSNQGVATVNGTGLVSGLSPGTTTITYNANNGCSTTSQFVVNALPVTSTTQVNVLCFGNSTGSIDLTATGGTSPYTYAWSNNTTQEDPTNLAAGTYSVTVTDANGCTAQTSVTITQPQGGLSLSTTQVNVLCYGNSTGSINLTATGGTSPYTYAWSNNTTQEDPTNLAAGTYSVTVTDGNGCTAQTSVTITQPQAPLALSTTQVNVLCFGNSTGSINLTVTGGTSPYTYSWSNNTTQEDPSNLASGTYSVTVTDANGCTSQTSVTITQPQAPLALSTTQVNVLCFGNSTGSIDLTATGGTSPYTYAWSNNTTQEDPTNLAAGTYSVTVTDANGCTSQTSVTITQPQAPLALSTTQVNILCYGNSTGSTNLTATGGTSPYTYAWSNNTTQEDPTNLAAGTYSVTVTDANGCTAQTSVTITQPQAPLALSTTQVNVLCFGNSTGSINLTVTGGTSPYTYAWSNNTTQEDLANLAAGTYSVTVTDANGCTSQTSVTITQPQGGLSLSATQVNVLCFGNSTGSINLTATGGTSPYTYAWSNNSTQEDLTNLSAGSYTVVVSDNSACTAQLTITITQPTTALSLSTMQVNVGCYGNSTGSINLTVSGGTSPYTYAWSNNTTQEDPTNLAAGTYSVTVTDANGCTSQTSVTITQPQAPLALSTTQVNVLCFGNSTGSVNLTVTGGTSPYTYLWSNNGTVEDPTGMASGTYSVTVTDANGCTSQTSVTITQPQAPLALSTTQVNVLCFGNSTGSIDLTATGGTSPYTYAWSNNTTQEDPTNLAAGTYSVTVTDANGCTAQTSVTITQPQAPLALSTTQVNVLCYANSTGSINLTATGGTSPYTYAWSNNTTQEDPTNLAAGTYSVTVTDGNGCTAQTTVSITQPSTALTASATAQNILCLNGTGSVTAQGNGAVAPYSYLWNNQATTQTVTGLLAGTYVATVMDANGCTVNVSATIVATLSPIPVQIINLTGTSILTCTTPSIQIQATGGVSYNWTGGTTPLNDTNSFNAPGTYIVNLIDPNGCTVVQSVTITQNITPPTPAIINNTGTAVLDCNNASISLTATGGGNYNWNNNLGTSQQVNVVQAGSYTVVITAANGCQDSATILITLAPTPSITLGDTTICSGQNVTISPVFYPSGGQAIWSNGLTSQSITVSPATTSTYNVLYDWNGCTVSEDAVITVIPTPSVSVSNFAICFGDSVQINAIANIPNGDFLWTPGNQTSSSILVSPTTSTSYSVQYTLNGCISPVSTSVVTVTPLPTLSVPTITICNGQPGTLTANTNTPGGTYMWSQGSTSQTITESPQLSTSYQVVYYANGCYSDTATGLIIVNPLPQAMFTIDTTSGCVPVTVTLTADTSGQIATYTWNSNGATQTAGQTAQMTFSLGGCFDISLTATMNGCTTTSNSNDLVCVQDYPIAAFTSYPPVFTESSQTLNFTNNSLGASGYVWSFGEGSLSNQENPEHYFQSVGEGALVTLTASTTMGCMDSASLYIPADLGPVYYIPNSFTPDGDKYNQVFLPVFTAGVDLNDFSMVIYNRWGEIMFETLNPYVGWDGSYGTEGLDCPVGTYTYKIRIKIPETDERRIITGHVNLIK